MGVLYFFSFVVSFTLLSHLSLTFSFLSPFTQKKNEERQRKEREGICGKRKRNDKKEREKKK